MKWTMTISGYGNSGRDTSAIEDADRQFEAILRQLKDAGHRDVVGHMEYDYQVPRVDADGRHLRAADGRTLLFDIRQGVLDLPARSPVAGEPAVAPEPDQPALQARVAELEDMLARSLSRPVEPETVVSEPVAIQLDPDPEDVAAEPEPERTLTLSPGDAVDVPRSGLLGKAHVTDAHIPTVKGHQGKRKG